MKTRKRHAKRRLKVLFIVAVLALIILMLLFAPIFNMSSITVTGSTRYTPDKIKEVSGLNLGENGFRQLNLALESIFELRLLDSEDKIEELPYVKNCIVRQFYLHYPKV